MRVRKSTLRKAGQAVGLMALAYVCGILAAQGFLDWLEMAA